MPGLKGFGQHKARLRHRPFHGINQQQDAVYQAHHALDFTAEVGVTGGVHDVDLDVFVGDRRVLGNDGDAALALQIHLVHDALGDGLVGAEDAALLEHPVHQGRLAVVNVGDNRDIPQVILC